MASAAAISPQQLRIVSRRAQHLLQKHAPPKPTTTNSGSKPKSTPTETPWPKPMRYTFYTVCAAAVPFTMGTAVAMSPRLRDWLLGDEVAVLGAGGANEKENTNVSTSVKIVNLVRQYWGEPDYVVPVDQPRMMHTLPGHRNEWQEDNWSSLLKFLGLYNSPSGASSSVEGKVPMSLLNEPLSEERKQQDVIAEYLSPEHNPTGVRVLLSLIPTGEDPFGDDGSNRNFGVSFALNLPANTPLSGLYKDIHATNKEGLLSELKEIFPTLDVASLFENVSFEGGSGSGSYRLVLDFPSKEGINTSGEEDLNDTSSAEGTTPLQDVMLSQGEADAKMLRQHTFGNSAWAYIPNDNLGSTEQTAQSKIGSHSMGGNAPSNGSKSGTNAATNNALNDLRIQQLKHHIASLQKELKDPASMRDRDSMEEELKIVKKELRSLQPGWWRRIWG